MEFLESLKSLGFPPIEHAILNMFMGSLDYPASIEARASKIAGDVRFCCTQKDSDTHVSFVLVCTWDVMIQLVICIPPDHEWHRCFVQALSIIRGWEGVADEDDPSGGDWSDLPQLSIRVREHCEYKPSESEDAFIDTESLKEWKAFTAFVSRLVKSGYDELIYLALWEISEALEYEPTRHKGLMDCEAWAAAEWILQCSHLLRKVMTPTEEYDKTFKKHPGPLFGEDSPTQSLQRWEFWKERLAGILNEAEALGIETETQLRIEEAMKLMV